MTLRHVLLDADGVLQHLPGGWLPAYDEDISLAHARLVVVEETVALTRRLRSAGFGVHLGTNQDAASAGFMRSVLAYDDLFDVSCYSCELGLAKPDPEFFRRAAELIGAPPSEVVFVDDTTANVEGAREAGMHALRWSIDRGHDELLSLLAAVGVRL